jgi:hypothetical protein
MEARGELVLARAGHEQMVERGTNAEPWPASMTAWNSASRDGFCENMLGEARSEVAGQSLCDDDDDDDESELERRRGSRKASEQESVAILPITAQQRVPALTSMAARRRAEPNVKAGFGQKSLLSPKMRLEGVCEDLVEDGGGVDSDLACLARRR